MFLEGITTFGKLAATFLPKFRLIWQGPSVQTPNLVSGVLWFWGRSVRQVRLDLMTHGFYIFWILFFKCRQRHGLMTLNVNGTFL